MHKNGDVFKFTVRNHILILIINNINNLNTFIKYKYCIAGFNKNKHCITLKLLIENNGK